MTPTGALSLICKAFTRIAKRGDVTTLDAYVASEEFGRLFQRVSPGFRASVMRRYEQAAQDCRVNLPVARAGTRRADWTRPGAVDEFIATWHKFDGNAERVAHALRITEGAARMAHSRFIVHGAATQQRQEAA